MPVRCLVLAVFVVAGCSGSPSVVPETKIEESSREGQTVEHDATGGKSVGDDSPHLGTAASELEVEDVRKSTARGLQWLVSKQNDDGGFGPTQMNPRLEGRSDVGMTAICLYAIARVPAKMRQHAGPVVANAVRFLLDRQQRDGSFYDPRDPSLQNYKTSVTGLALLTLDREKYRAQIDRGVEFITSQQFAEPLGYDRDRDLHYGGIGYGNRSNVKSDLSNTNYALEFLNEAGESDSSSVYERAQQFLTRAQNSKDGDPLRRAAGIRTTGDGGFPYSADSTRGPVESLDDGSQRFSSYGSMSYAGLKSFLHAQVERDDPRVQAVYGWVRANWTLTENPGMATPEDPVSGQQGLYYYFHSLSKALDVYGEPDLIDTHGRRHDWARELAARLVNLQRPAGSWVNEADRWMEGLPEITTSFSLLALTICLDWIESRSDESTGE
jgi:squalene-hopene/tetraprenyl-beta-curcumene cyclase